MRRDDMVGRADANIQAELVADDLRFTFPPRPGSPSGHRVLDGVSLSVRSGERVGLIGRSGCGKSTLLRILLGLTAPSAGTVRFAGREVRPGPLRSLRDYRRHVQLIPQDPAASLVPRLTAERNVLVPLIRLQVPEPRLEIARWALERVGLDERYWGRRPHELSGGQAQRVAVARALALGPDIVLADEPVSGLDHDLRDQVLDLLHELSLDAGARGFRVEPGMPEAAGRTGEGAALRSRVEPGTTEPGVLGSRVEAGMTAAAGRTGEGAALRSRVEPGTTEPGALRSRVGPGMTGAPGVTEAPGVMGATPEGRGRRLGVLFVSHDPEAVERLCDRTLVLADGRITDASTPATTERTP